ncbi:class I SAM-dependent methyltransferase [Flavobacterium silvaticum]|uniref:Class I SAM-dependent methyltransferase n=1 Tax=Flavobacterium silvaticum TaxID=1852020 RepID=A0A972FKC2_9FLAO|nr:class I SAM-dependent methyltransferase [Flavobacterium silvaticum]NMH27272.1 class I SAM-dependent methyltransferase [Flavobacterium silvaticum]
MKDLFGLAILDFQTDNEPEDLITETSISEPDVMNVSWLFRSYSQMPKLEKKALQLSHGKVLEVGCGAASHGLYLQDERNLEVHSIDISPKAIEACRLRGIKNASVADIMELSGEKYDTILMLMNGTGICGKYSNLSAFLKKLKSLLRPNGQILIDSSDIIYMFDQDEDGAVSVPASSYYGELEFRVQYKGEFEEPFFWLYLDYNTLHTAANANGLKCEIAFEGKHFDYLARLFV